MIFALIFLGALAFIFERRKVSAKEIAVIAVLAALAGLGRVPFAFIPSAQPTTFFVIMTGIVFGIRAGFWVGCTAALVSNAFLGQGPWTIVQMLAWGLCGISAGILGRLSRIYVPYVIASPIGAKQSLFKGLLRRFASSNDVALIFFGFLWGYLFGWITNLWYWLSFVYPLNWQSWLSTNILSFWFDTTHAVTNVLFLGILGPSFLKILNRFKQKFSYRYEK